MPFEQWLPMVGGIAGLLSLFTVFTFKFFPSDGRRGGAAFPGLQTRSTKRTWTTIGWRWQGRGISKGGKANG